MGGWGLCPEIVEIGIGVVVVVVVVVMCMSFPKPWQRCVGVWCVGAFLGIFLSVGVCVERVFLS